MLLRDKPGVQPLNNITFDSEFKSLTVEYIDIKSISELLSFFNYEKPVHPLIAVVDLSKVDRSHRKEGIFYRLNLYSIACKKIEGAFKYGRTDYDFSEGSLMFTAPNQVLSPGIENKVQGWAIYIHPHFLYAADKGIKLTDYSFFGYDTHESLHISESEKGILDNCLANITQEISINLDAHSQNLILTNLDLLLSYCSRFYDRQFLSRAKVSNDVVENFDRLLTEYFAKTSLIEVGLPDVKYFASALSLSINYLTDLLTKYTGKSTNEHIHLKLIEKAKSLLWSTDHPISSIAYDLGFAHASHFTKLFKTKTGYSPRAFRQLN